MRSRRKILVLSVAMTVLTATLGGICRAETVSIFKMPVNNRIWEVYETNPLTSASEGRVARAWVSPNGANIAYVAVTPEASRLCVRNISGGKASVIAVAGRDPGVSNKPDGEKKIRWDLDQLNLVWSADSRLVAFPVFDDEPMGETSRTKDWTWIVTFTAAGEQKSSFPLPRTLELVGDIQWSHDVRKIAMVVKPHLPDNSLPTSSSILLLDLFAGAAQPIYTQQDAVMSLVGWSKGGKALRFTSPVGNREVQLMELDLDSRKASAVDLKQSAETVTDDWDYRLLNTETGLALENRHNSKRITLCRDASARFLGWTPNGLATYSRVSELADDRGERREQLTSLWLSRPLQMGVNSMCIALDIDPLAAVTCSQDCSIIGFISEGRLCASRINRRQPTIVEKAVYRMPLDPQEDRKVALARGAALAKAFMSYQAKSGSLPAKETVVADLRPFIVEPMVTDRFGKFISFTYNPPIALVDTGRSVDLGYVESDGAWRVVVSSDGKTRIESK